MSNRVNHPSAMSQKMLFWEKTVLIKNLLDNILPVQKGGFLETPYPKDRLEPGSWRSTCLAFNLFVSGVHT